MGVFVDVREALVRTEIEFWAGALGATVEATSRPGTYTALKGVVAQGGDLLFEVQRLDDGSPRYHVDLEAADVPAEAARLEALGATPVHEIETWITLADPAGNLLCVVPADHEAPLVHAYNAAVDAGDFDDTREWARHTRSRRRPRDGR